MLSLKDIKDYLAYKPETGEFFWIKKPCTRILVGSKAENKRKDGYVGIGFGGKRYLAHRLAWFFTHGYLPEKDIDHINGDPSDNRIENLREATRSENLFNQKLHSNNTSGYRGVIRCKRTNKWQAGSQLNGKYRFLGLHDSKEEAKAAYEKFAAKHHKEFKSLRS